jgi:histidyl-tRNA synthetase
MMSELNSDLSLEFDLTLARGLNYYTGAIIEVKANDVSIGSICGGGRYDNLTGIFGMPDVSGVGISFGADRIYDVLNQLNLYPESIASTTQILITNFGEKEQNHCLQLLNTMRKSGIRAELYPDPVKLKKQMSYANNRQIPYVLLVGEQEIATGIYGLKNMQSGEQENLNQEQLFAKLIS